MLKDYYQLTKPGIIYGNLLTVVAGFLFASQGYFQFSLFLAVVIGASLLIASGCVFNNYLDREIDRAMARTKKRALVTGRIKVSHALGYATALGFSGIVVLGLFTNITTLLVGLTGFIFYVVIYGYAKRRTSYGTLVGSVSGSVPVVAGYTAVTGNFDIGALLLFLIMASWQMPHFYAIAMYRLEEYKKAKIPVLPAVRGLKATQQHIMMYIILYIFLNWLLWATGYVGVTYLIGMTILGGWWFYKGWKRYNTSNLPAWGRTMFLCSLIVLLGFALLLSVGSILP